MTFAPTYELVEVDTTDASPAERFDRWRDHVRANHGGLDFIGCDPTAFRGSTVVQRAGDLQLVEFWSDPITYARRSGAARIDGDATVRVLVPRSGQFQVEAGDERLLLGPGTAAVVSMASSFSISHAGNARAWVLSMPEALWSRSTDLRRSHVLDLSSGLGAMAATMTAQLSHERDAWSTADFLEAADSVAHLLVRSVVGGVESSWSQVARSTADLIRAQSDDPTLTPATLAERLGWSLRHVQAVTNDLDTTPSRMIRAARLERAHARLRDPALADRGIAEIAHASGFGSVSGFNSAFRDVFGQSPREVRRVIGA